MQRLCCALLTSTDSLPCFFNRTTGCHGCSRSWWERRFCSWKLCAIFSQPPHRPSAPMLTAPNLGSCRPSLPRNPNFIYPYLTCVPSALLYSNDLYHYFTIIIITTNNSFIFNIIIFLIYPATALTQHAVRCRRLDGVRVEHGQWAGGPLIQEQPCQPASPHVLGTTRCWR